MVPLLALGVGPGLEKGSRVSTVGLNLSRERLFVVRDTTAVCLQVRLFTVQQCAKSKPEVKTRYTQHRRRQAGQQLETYDSVTVHFNQSPRFTHR